LGMYWRRVNKTAVWGTICFSTLVFFVLPVLIPMLQPDLRSDPSLAVTTNIVTKTYQRPATEVDIERYTAWLVTPENQAIQQPPEATEVGQTLSITTAPSGGQSIFWRGGMRSTEGETVTRELIKQYSEGETDVRVERTIGAQVGTGGLNLDFILYRAIGIDLSSASKGTLEALRLPTRLLLPFIVLFLLSHFTRRGSDESLNRYFAKMNTPVLADQEADRRALEAAYASPETTNSRKLLPGSDWEFVKPTTKDVIGFVAACGACVVIIGSLVWLASVGA